MIEALRAISEFIKDGGWLAVLLLVLFSGYYGMWQFGSSVKRLLDEKDLRIADLQKNLGEAVSGWRGQTDATKLLTSAVNERNQIELENRRIDGERRHPRPRSDSGRG